MGCGGLIWRYTPEGSSKTLWTNSQRGENVAKPKGILAWLDEGRVVMWEFQDGFATPETCRSTSQVASSQLPRIKSALSELVPS